MSQCSEIETLKFLVKSIFRYRVLLQFALFCKVSLLAIFCNLFFIFSKDFEYFVVQYFCLSKVMLQFEAVDCVFEVLVAEADRILLDNNNAFL